VFEWVPTEAALGRLYDGLPVPVGEWVRTVRVGEKRSADQALQLKGKQNEIQPIGANSNHPLDGGIDACNHGRRERSGCRSGFHLGCQDSELREARLEPRADGPARLDFL